MNKAITLLIVTGFLFSMTSEALSQFRDDLPSPYERTGQITRTDDTEGLTNMFGLFDMTMNQSYEMTFGAFGGGNTYNQNILTNTMHLRFNEDLHGRVDVAMSHSPFGNSPMGQQQDFNFFIRNAELQYDITDNATVRFQYQQNPGGYRGYYGSPYGYSPYSRYSRW